MERDFLETNDTHISFFQKGEMYLEISKSDTGPISERKFPKRKKISRLTVRCRDIPAQLQAFSGGRCPSCTSWNRAHHTRLLQRARVLPRTSPWNSPVLPGKILRRKARSLGKILVAINRTVTPKHPVVLNPHTLSSAIPVGHQCLPVLDVYITPFSAIPQKETEIPPCFHLGR